MRIKAFRAPGLFGRVLIAAAVLGLLTSCSQSKGPERPRIALVMKSLANEFFLTMENGARAHQKAHAAQYDLLANGIKDELDVARQIDLVDQMIASGSTRSSLLRQTPRRSWPCAKKPSKPGLWWSISITSSTARR